MIKIIHLLSILVLFNIVILKYNLSSHHITPIHNSYIDYNLDDNNLIVSILKDAQKQDLIEYVDYINLSIIDTIPNDNENNKIAFTLSLPQQISFIAIYEKDLNQNLNFKYIIDDLSNLTDFYFYKDFIVVEQNENTDSNPLEKKSFLEVFLIKENKTESVFEKNIKKDEIIQNDDKIVKNVENSSIDFLDGDVPRILCVTSFTTYQSDVSNPSDEEFIETDKYTLKEVYEWDNINQGFILKNKKEL